MTYEGKPARALTVVRLSIERKGLLKPEQALAEQADVASRCDGAVPRGCGFCPNVGTHLPKVKNALFGLAVVAVCGAFVWGGMAVKNASKPIPKKPAPHSFVWSDRVPLSDAMLTAWLGQRGAKFRAWAKLHPVAARKLAEHNAPDPR